MDVPYYSQWESPELVSSFVSGALQTSDDPLWRNSGANSVGEYAFWAPRICGIACLRMALSFHGHAVPPAVELAKDALNFGAYRLEGQNEISGLVYSPFADWVRQRWNLQVEVHANLTQDGIKQNLRLGRLSILSVHKNIRDSTSPPSRGGHLVLGLECDDDAIYIHNPSGLNVATQINHRVTWSNFHEYYAARGMVIHSNKFDSSSVVNHAPSPPAGSEGSSWAIIQG